MHEMRIMGAKGDNLVTWKPELEDSVEKAQSVFDEYLLRGFFAFVIEDGNDVMVREFPKEAERIIMVPRISGG